MDNGRVEYSFLWFIENYSYCWHENGERLISPLLKADELEGTAWTIQVYPRGIRNENKGDISLFLNRSKADDGPESITIKCKLSILTVDGSDVATREFGHEFKKGAGFGGAKLLQADEVLVRRNTNYLPQDILTVRCKIWKGEGKVYSSGQSSARTRIRIEKNSFFHEVGSFSTLQPNIKQPFKIHSHSKEGLSISSRLYITEGLCCDEKIMIELVPSSNIICKHKFFLLDVSGNIAKCGEIDNRCDAVRKSIYILPLSVTREAILKRKNEYLPDDKLSLLCECTFSTGLIFEEIEETLHKMPLMYMKQKSNHFPSNAVSKSAETLSPYSSISEDIKALYIDQYLTDVELKTETKSFPAHKIVLCARSAVFKAMLSNDMKEKYNNCIYIDDLGDDIVEQLLLFLYSDRTENLQWKTATQLYYAADKYQVGKLQKICSSFLRENLIPSNASELLLLADTHNDTDLKKVVEDFILEHEEQVFGSNEWEKLIETHPLLVIKTMHLKYKRKQ